MLVKYILLYVAKDDMTGYLMGQPPLLCKGNMRRSFLESLLVSGALINAKDDIFTKNMVQILLCIEITSDFRKKPACLAICHSGSIKYSIAKGCELISETSAMVLDM